MRALNCATGMHSALCFQVSHMRNLGRLEVAKSGFAAIDNDAGHPFLFVFINAKQPARLIRCPSLFNVLSVNGWRNVTQILNFVVQAVAVNVVNIAIRPASVHIEPSKTMGRMSYAVNAHDPVIRPGFFQSPPILSLVETTKKPAFWVVMENLAQTLRGKIGSSHDALLLLIGQRPARVSARGGLRYFSVV